MSWILLRAAAYKLIASNWLQIYPEGQVPHRGMQYSKRDICKILTMSFEVPSGLPFILPMYHICIECVMPQNIKTNRLETFVPRSGQSTFVVMRNFDTSAGYMTITAFITLH